MIALPKPSVGVADAGQPPDMRVRLFVQQDSTRFCADLTASQALDLARDLADSAQRLNRAIEAHRQEQQLRKDGLI